MLTCCFRLQQLQHESSRYLGHTPSSAVVKNSSSIGPGTDWGSALADNVAMMSLLDCEYAPDNHHSLLGSNTWSNSGQVALEDSDFRFRQVAQQSQLPSRLSNINNRGPRLQNQQVMRQNTDPVGYSNHVYDSVSTIPRNHE